MFLRTEVVGMKVHFVGGPHDGLVIDLDKKTSPPQLWKVPIDQDPPQLIPKCWLYDFSSENKTYYMRKGVHDG